MLLFVSRQSNDCKRVNEVREDCGSILSYTWWPGNTKMGRQGEMLALPIPFWWVQAWCLWAPAGPVQMAVCHRLWLCRGLLGTYPDWSAFGIWLALPVCLLAIMPLYENQNETMHCLKKLPLKDGVYSDRMAGNSWRWREIMNVIKTQIPAMSVTTIFTSSDV